MLGLMDESSPLKLSHKYEVLQAPPIFSVTSDKVPCRGSAVSSGIGGGGLPQCHLSSQPLQFSLWKKPCKIHCFHPAKDGSRFLKLLSKVKRGMVPWLCAGMFFFYLPYFPIKASIHDSNTQIIYSIINYRNWLFYLKELKVFFYFRVAIGIKMLR